MIEICLRTLFAGSPDEWRSRDRIFAKTALDFTDIVSATEHELIFPPTRGFGKEFCNEAGIRHQRDASRKK
jgi:hypothetical protein